jgi:hypothetical protein
MRRRADLRFALLQAPPLTSFGFAFLLVFVFATIPAGIYGARACSRFGFVCAAR